MNWLKIWHFRFAMLLIGYKPAFRFKKVLKRRNLENVYTWESSVTLGVYVIHICYEQNRCAEGTWYLFKGQTSWPVMMLKQIFSLFFQSWSIYFGTTFLAKWPCSDMMALHWEWQTGTALPMTDRHCIVNDKLALHC